MASPPAAASSPTAVSWEMRIAAARLVGGTTHFCSSVLSISAICLLDLLSNLPHIFAAILPHPPAPVYIYTYIASHHAPGILSLRRRGSQRWASAPCCGHWQQRQRGPAAGVGAPRAEFSANQCSLCTASLCQLPF